MQSQRFFQTLLQTTSSTRIDVVQLVMDPQQSGLGFAIAAEIVGIGQTAVPAGLLFISEMTNDVATLVKLATENRTAFSTILTDAGTQRLAAVNDIQMQLPEIQTAAGQVREQTITRALVFTGALMKPKNRFAPYFIDAQRSHQVLLLDLDAIQQQNAQAQFRQIPFEKPVHLPGAHRDELLADRRLLNGKCLLRFAHRRSVTARRQASCDRLPDPLLLLLVSAEKLIAANLHVPFLATDSRPVDRHLLSIDHYRPVLVSPTLDLPAGAATVPCAGHPIDLVFHDEGQQLKLSLQQKLSYTTSQLLGNFCQRQDHLNRAMIVQQMGAELLDGSSFVDLIGFLHLTALLD